MEIRDLPNINFNECNDYQSLYNRIELLNQIQTQNPSDKMFDFFRNFKFIEASGGIVQCGKQFLFIKRNDRWDIPKGKIEKNETPESAAIREIQEECGLKREMRIRKKLTSTYHTYEFNNKSILKKTHWFMLDYMGEMNTKPQLEEGITEIIWIGKDEFHKIKSNTYSSILDVLECFENS